MIANGSSQQNLSPIEAEKVIIAYNPEVVEQNFRLYVMNI